MHPDHSRAVTATARQDRLPEIELAAPLRVPPQLPAADGGADQVFLIRLHSIPIGLATLPATTDTRGAEGVATEIEEQLGDVIRDHLRRDRAEAAPRADLGGSALPPGGLPWPADAACLAPRRKLLAHAPRVTVVVPVANRPDLLETCLADLAEQSYPDYSVVIVDNAPARSGAAAVVDAAIVDAAGRDGGVSFQYVTEPRPGSSRARNRGLRASTTELTVFVDSDVRLDRNWLVELVRPLVEDARTGCSTGLILPTQLVEPGERLLFEWGGYDQGFEPRVFERDQPANGVPLHPYQPGVFGSGQSMAFRTAALRAVGGFDVSLGIRTPSQGGEDQAAMLDVLLDGWRLSYTPAAVVWHPDPSDTESVVRKLNSYGVGLTALLTRVVVRRPRAALDILARMPGALAYFFRGGSRRNRRHSDSYPRRAIWAAELRGMAWGPFAYAKSVLTTRRRRRSGPSRSPAGTPTAK